MILLLLKKYIFRFINIAVDGHHTYNMSYKEDMVSRKTIIWTLNLIIK